MASKRKVPAHKSEPKWDNSRNVATYGRRLYAIAASSLKLRGTIYKSTPVSDGAGGWNHTLSVRGEAWMSVRLVRTDQIFEYRGKDVKVTHVVKVRYETEIEETDSIIISGNTYEVIHINRDEDRRLLKSILCIEMR